MSRIFHPSLDADFCPDRSLARRAGRFQRPNLIRMPLRCYPPEIIGGVMAHRAMQSIDKPRSCPEFRPAVSTRRRRGRLLRRPASPTPPHQPSCAARVKGREAARHALALDAREHGGIEPNRKHGLPVFAEHGPYADREQRCSTFFPRAIAPYIHCATPCGTVRCRRVMRHHSASIRIIPSHAGSSRISPGDHFTHARKFPAIDLHPETTKHLDVRAFRGILAHACG